MHKKSRVYIAGHTGFIGSALTGRLKERGYRNLLLKTRRELDLTNQIRTEAFFKTQRPEFVFLLAARVGGIRANSLAPAEFLYQNIAIQTNVMQAAYKYGARKLLFLGSACMYPKFCPQPMKPEYLLTGPIEPTNEAFAIAKICGIKMCQAYNRQYKTRFISAIPATVYGPGDHFGETGHVAAGLIEKFLKARGAAGKKEVVRIWGTGRPKREFLFIGDAVEALIFLMQRHNGNGPVNIGSGQETTIKALAQKIAKLTHSGARIVYETDKPDGIPRRLLDSSEIKKLGWQAKTALDEGLERTLMAELR